MKDTFTVLVNKVKKIKEIKIKNQKAKQGRRWFKIKFIERAMLVEL